MIIAREFYRQKATEIAPALLGQRLVRVINGKRMSGIIVETEAYSGIEDGASHSHRGKTVRNAPMWGDGGYSYLYLIYGVYWLLNVSCEPAEVPGAVLIRAIEPDEGIDLMRENRPVKKDLLLTNGPGKLTIALKLDQSMNQVDMTNQQSGLWIEHTQPVPSSDRMQGARIGLGKNVSDEWRNIKWRWWLKDHPYVSA